MTPRPALIVLVLLSICSQTAHAQLPRPGARRGSSKWIRLTVNMGFATPARVLTVVDAAAAAGATTVLISDGKLQEWWFRSPGARWLRRMHAVRDGVRERGLDFVLESEGLGYCTGPVASDVNLAAGYPLERVRMRVSGSGRTLQPMDHPDVPNPSFERASSRNSNRPVGWGYQDAPGTATFLDSSVRRSGSRSLRLDARSGGGGESRLFGNSIAIRPFHQYTLTAYMRAEALTADFVSILLRDATTEAELTSQDLSLPGNGRRREYFSSTQGLTTDGWVRQRLAFNSQRCTAVQIALGVWGGVSGRIWWDDLELRSTPLLNLLRRDALPFRLVAAGGRALREGTHYRRVTDARLGRTVSYDGVYDTYHDAPAVQLRRRAGLSAGDVVWLSGFHTMVTQGGQVGCSWSDEGLKRVIRTTHRRNEREFSPDGVMLGHNEIRTGGWEPAEVALGSSGNALAAFLAWEIEVVRSGLRRRRGNRDQLYMWSDMVDPNTNAVADYYQVRGSLRGSWEGLAPDKIVVMNWSGNSDNAASYRFFHRRGYAQVAAAFYDDDVSENRQNWVSSFAGRPSAGSMYTTWVSGDLEGVDGDFSKVNDFADAWW